MASVILKFQYATPKSIIAHMCELVLSCLTFKSEVILSILM